MVDQARHRRATDLSPGRQGPSSLSAIAEWPNEVPRMPLFVVERRFVSELDLDSDDLQELEDYHAANDIRWLTSFLSADRKKTYCLYEAPDADALRQQAATLDLPVDAVIEVSEMDRSGIGLDGLIGSQN